MYLMSVIPLPELLYHIVWVLVVMPLFHCLHTEPSFGLELASVFDCHAQKAPTAVLKCIEAVESRGEGLGPLCVQYQSFIQDVLWGGSRFVG